MADSTFPAYSTVNILGDTLSSSAIFNLANVSTYNIYGANLNIDGGSGSLTLVSGTTLSGEDYYGSDCYALNVDDLGSGGTLSAQGVTFTTGASSSVTLDSGATASLVGDTFISGVTVNSGAAAILTNDNFKSGVWLAAGSSPTLSGDTFASGDLYVAPQLVRAVAGMADSTFPAYSTVNILGDTLSSSAIFNLANVSTYNIYGANLNIDGGSGSLTLVSGTTLSGEDYYGSNCYALNVYDLGSGGTLSAQGVTFTTGASSSVTLDSGATASLVGDTFISGVTVNSGAAATLTNDNFKSSVYLYAGSSPTLSGDTFAIDDLYVAPQLVSAVAGSTFPAGSKVNVFGGTLTTSLSFPFIANVNNYDLYNATLNIGGGASLIVAAGDTISGYSLYVGDNGSAGTLLAEGVTFSNEVYLGPLSHGTVEFDTFGYSGYNYFDGQMLATVMDDNFAASEARSQGTGGPINLENNYWGPTSQSTSSIEQKIYANNADPPLIDFTPWLATGPMQQLAFTAQPSGTTAEASITPAVQVSVEDTNGNVLAIDNSSVTVALVANPGGGTLGGTLTEQAVNGVATFSNLSINNAGTGYTLIATDGSYAGTTSSSFSITPGNPIPVSVTTSQPTGTYGTGTTIPITLNFNHAVLATGTPLLALDNGATASYVSGSGSTALTFSFTITAGQNTADLD